MKFLCSFKSKKILSFIYKVPKESVDKGPASEKEVKKDPIKAYLEAKKPEEKAELKIEADKFVNKKIQESIGQPHVREQLQKYLEILTKTVPGIEQEKVQYVQKIQNKLDKVKKFEAKKWSASDYIDFIGKETLGQRDLAMWKVRINDQFNVELDKSDSSNKKNRELALAHLSKLEKGEPFTEQTLSTYEAEFKKVSPEGVSLFENYKKMADRDNNGEISESEFRELKTKVDEVKTHMSRLPVSGKLPDEDIVHDALARMKASFGEDSPEYKLMLGRIAKINKEQGKRIEGFKKHGQPSTGEKAKETRELTPEELAKSGLITGEYRNSLKGYKSDKKVLFLRGNNGKELISDEDIGVVKRLSKFKGLMNKPLNLETSSTSDFTKYGEALAKAGVDRVLFPFAHEVGLMGEQGRDAGKTPAEATKNLKRAITVIQTAYKAKTGKDLKITPKHAMYGVTEKNARGRYKNTDESARVFGRRPKGSMDIYRNTKDLVGIDSYMVDSVIYKDSRGNKGKARNNMVPSFMDKGDIAYLRENVGNKRIMTDDLSAFVDTNFKDYQKNPDKHGDFNKWLKSQGINKASKENYVKYTVEGALKAGVDQVMFVKNKDYQKIAQDISIKYLTNLKDKNPKVYKARVARMENGSKPVDLSVEGQKFNDKIKGLASTEKRVAELKKEKNLTPKQKSELEAGKKALIGYGEPDQFEIDKKRPEWKKQKEIIKGKKRKELAKLGEKEIKGKPNKEVLDWIEQSQDKAAATFLEKQEDGSFKVDFKNVDETLIGMGHFEKELMSKYAYVKVFNPKTGQTVIGARGVKPGSKKPGYFDIKTGAYIPIFTGSIIKGLKPSDIQKLDKSTKNAMASKDRRPMSLSDYFTKAKTKRNAYKDLVEKGLIGGRGLVDLKNLKPGVTGMLDLIADAEGTGNNYNAVFGNGRQSRIDFSTKTLDEVMAYQRGMKPSSALGRYQFMRATLGDLKRSAGLSGNEKFTPALQDKLAIRLMERRGLRKFQSGRMSASAFQSNLAYEWASLPKNASGATAYGGDGLNMTQATSGRHAQMQKQMATLREGATKK